MYIYPGVLLATLVGTRHTCWLIPYFQVWHVPQMMARPSLVGCVPTTPIIMYQFTGCVAATLKFAREHPTTLVPYTAKLLSTLLCKYPKLLIPEIKLFGVVVVVYAIESGQ